MRTVLSIRLVILTALGVLTLWAYWPTLAVMGHKWVIDPQYSHGYLVPAFAAVLLWLRRAQLSAVVPQANAWGVLLIGVGLLLRLAGVYTYLDWLDAFSILPCLAGFAVLLGGWPALRWSWPAIAFLAFMIPLPFRVETAMSHPLQRIATLASAYVMQLVGLPALAEGNTILLNQGKIGVVETCSGLSMMLLFFALSVAVTLVIKRPLLDKAVILLSAAPIAVLANVARITVTGAAQELINPQVAQAIFHDWAGWLMMPFALGLLWCELWVLSRALVEPSAAADPVALRVAKPAAPTPAVEPSKPRREKRQPRSAAIPCPVLKR